MKNTAISAENISLIVMKNTAISAENISLIVMKNTAISAERQNSKGQFLKKN